MSRDSGWFFKIAACLALIAASPPPPPPPPIIASYIVNGEFDPGDYKWLRGAFDQASPAESAQEQAVLNWRKSCRESGIAETRSELELTGIRAATSLATIPYRVLVCAQVATLPEAIDFRNWTVFASDVVAVRPIVEGFLTAVAITERTSGVEDPDLRTALEARATVEQTLRTGLDWATGASVTDRPTRSLTAQQRGILAAQIAIAMQARDHANTRWLKAVVAAGGWPKRSKVGEGAAKSAWLLAQHADADPAFQLQALKLIEPLIATGEANRKDYAFLKDRVTLKIDGKQRYGTQLICENGRFVAPRLEDASRVEASRKAVGLDTLERTLARAGTC